ncbi:MAG: hypothetical protein CL820_00750 [Croceicoccus sp.]|nr:hypothetical protein [Croceicoccus sp.]|tara:strand:+ start:88829 stop:89068 length:240 start_codon:yes stop_codon:yes gene_type:complete
MIYAATPAMRVPIRFAVIQPVARRRAAVKGWFGRRINPLMQQVAQDEPEALFWGLTTRDAKEFLMAYCACFMAVVGFIA